MNMTGKREEEKTKNSEVTFDIIYVLALAVYYALLVILYFGIMLYPIYLLCSIDLHCLSTSQCLLTTLK